MLSEADILAIEQDALTPDVSFLVASAAIMRDGKLLLCTRSDEDTFLPSHIEMPGGRVERGESLFAGLHREIREETKLLIRAIISALPSFDYHNLKDARLIRQCSFLVECDGQVQLDPREHSSYFWLSPSHRGQLEGKLVTPQQLALIESAFESMELVA